MDRHRVLPVIIGFLILGLAACGGAGSQPAGGGSTTPSTFQESFQDSMYAHTLHSYGHHQSAAFFTETYVV